MKKSTPPAELARCYRSGDHFYFYIGKAQDADATVAALTDQVPISDYRYDASTKEWRLAERHADLLESLFTNFPKILRQQSGASLPLGSSPYNYSNNGPFSRPLGYVRNQRLIKTDRLSLVAWIAIVGICIALWPWLSEGDTPSSLAVLIGQSTGGVATSGETTGVAVQAAPTVSQSQATPIPTATAKPTALPATGTVFQTANLRAGPGTEYEIVGQLENEDRVNVTGQVLVPGSFSWYRLDNGLWIYSQLVSGPSAIVPIIEAEDLP